MCSDTNNPRGAIAMIKLIDRIKKTLMYYLAQRVDGKRFTGKIIIQINCNDGGIGNTSVTVQQKISESC
jgi:hypothetical protein